MVELFNCHQNWLNSIRKLSNKLFPLTCSRQSQFRYFRDVIFVNKPCICGYARLKKSGYTSFDSTKPNFVFQSFPPPLVKIYWDKRNVESSLAVLPLDRLFQIFSTGTLKLAVALTFSDLFVTPTLEKDEESTPKVTLNTMKLTKTNFILDGDFQRIALLPR